MGQHKLYAYMANSGWMLAEQLLRLISGVLVGVYIARYLGPEQFGILSYVIAVVAFLVVVARLGMDAILVRELAQDLHAGRKLGTAMALMLGAAALCYSLLLLVLYVSNEPLAIKHYLALASLSVFLVMFYAFDFLFQARVEAKRGAMAKSAALSIMVVVKLLFIWQETTLVWFVAAYLMEHVLVAVCLLGMYKYAQPIDKLSISKADIKPLLGSAWPMVLAGLSSLIYMRIDQLMLRHMLGMEEVGIYAAAARIYEAWILIPFVLSTSLLPFLVAVKKASYPVFIKRMQWLFSGMVAMTSFAALIAYWLSEPIILFAFGPSYQASASILPLLMASAIFTSVHSLTVRYMTVEHLERKVAKRTFAAALLNIVANAILIPALGVQGAAWSTLLTMFFIAYVMDYLEADLKPLARIKRNALLKPLVR
ncbi:flippase [Halomonas sediminis]